MPRWEKKQSVIISCSRLASIRLQPPFTFRSGCSRPYLLVRIGPTKCRYRAAVKTVPDRHPLGGLEPSAELHIVAEQCQGSETCRPFHGMCRVQTGGATRTKLGGPLRLFGVVRFRKVARSEVHVRALIPFSFSCCSKGVEIVRKVSDKCASLRCVALYEENRRNRRRQRSHAKKKTHEDANRKEKYDGFK